MAKRKRIKGKNLVIVESPTKEKTISRFLDDTFIVRSSFGHVRDLPTESMGVDENNGFKPTYKILPRAAKILPELNSIAERSENIYLATDPDREGEAIAWHLMEIINADRCKFKRISFHEITKSAISDSLKEPQQINFNLVNAQQARRVLDRIVGYKLSPLLWAKVKSGLSAGRVQSIAVRFVSEREKEIRDFGIENYFSVQALLFCGGEFSARLSKWRQRAVEETRLLKLFAEDYRYRTSIFKKFEEAAESRNYLSKADLKVSCVDRKEVKTKPKPPFITSTLQQDAYNKLGFSSDRTMRVAQSLYEGVALKGERTGLITYMRTDSFNLSQQIKTEAQRFIKEVYGDVYYPGFPRLYQKKIKGAQEAHEAIRPTSVWRKPENLRSYLTSEQFKLYDLIWRRFLACQMADAVHDSLSVEISGGRGEAVLKAGGRSLKFDGYLKVYSDFEQGRAQEEKMPLPGLEVGQKVEFRDAEIKEHKTSPPPRYNEASLIRTLEKHGIGRPSTYAVIIKTIIDRGYIKQNPKEKNFAISQLGELVTDKLKGFFPDIMDITYTASVEEKLDGIAEGREEWVKTVNEFYRPFMNNLMRATEGMALSKPDVQKTDEKCPLCGNYMVLRESRFGKYLSCSRFPKCRGKIPLDKDGNKKEVFNPLPTEKICSRCRKNKMLLRKSKKGFFLACEGFPKCRNTESVEEGQAHEIMKRARKEKE